LRQNKQKISLDEIDKRIISELQKNSRISFTEIGKRLNLSETAIRNRVNVLTKSGVIKKFTVQLDFDKIGKSIMAIIGVKVGGEVMRTVASKLSDMNEIAEIYTMTGEYDIILKIICNNHQTSTRTCFSWPKKIFNRSPCLSPLASIHIFGNVIRNEPLCSWSFLVILKCIFNLGFSIK